MRFSVILLGLFLAINIAYAQEGEASDTTALSKKDSLILELSELKWRKKLFFADKNIEAGNELDAIMVYEMVLEDKPNDRYTIYQLGKANFDLKHYSAAEVWLDSLVGIDSLKYPLTQYYLAKSLKFQGKYKQAISRFQSFQATSFGKANDELRHAQATVDNDIAGCKLGIELTANPGKARIIHLDSAVNHPQSDYAPLVLPDTSLLYAALAANDVVSIDDDSAQQRFTRFYLSKREGHAFLQSEKFDFPYNSGEYHIGNGTFSQDASHFYFTRCTEEYGMKMHCQIFESAWNDTAWGVPVALSFNGEDHSTTHPRIANVEGDEVLFFASDMEGTLGGMDIWSAKKGAASGEFNEVTNLGANINTEEDEATPFYDAKNKMLYFSSKGRVSMGGFDVYSSVQNSDSVGGWSKPVNMGSPLNTGVDDLYFILEGKGRKGFLVSNRPGGYSLLSPTCCDDIWQFKYPPQFVFVEGKLLDELTQEPIDSGMLKIYLAGKDSLVKTIPIEVGGKYRVKLPGDKDYKIVASSLKYYDKEVELSTKDRDDGETIMEDIGLKKRPFWKGQNMGIVYYDFDKHKLRRDARPVLDTIVQILKQFPDMMLEVQGHTDHMGDTIYNRKLSERRAEAVYNYLIRKDIPEEQLVMKGYGETRPVAPNKNPDGTDNPEGRQLNRRTQFAVVGEIKTK